MNFKIFKKKKIIVTGHTGFKGSWLVNWLHHLGADVTGVSLTPENKNYHFKYIKKEININDIRLDIRNAEKLEKIIFKIKPDFVFHLAAQSIVSISYDKPKYTFETNVLGTLNLLTSLSKLKKKCVAIMVTSDKCYKNKEISKGYKENDELGGDDFYSSSKASTELMINSFFKSFIINKNNYLKICTARAGNVVGGGDWSKDRLIPDCIKKWSSKKFVILRNPRSTRPWQHVLEALNGYLTLAYKLSNNSQLNGHSFNFSNDNIKNYSVLKFVKELKKNLPNLNWKLKENKKFKETNLLQLNNKKAKKILKWKNILSIKETASLVSSWYYNFYTSGNREINTLNQIKYFMRLLRR